MASNRVFTSISTTVSRLCASRTPTLQALTRPRRAPLPSTALTPASVRLAHAIPRPRKSSSSPFAPSQPSSSSPQPQEQQQQQSDAPAATTPSPPPKHLQPHYELTFTCNPCGHRSRHRVSKHGYHKGTVLIACPSCRARHVISDHLKIFGDKAMTVEDLLRERGEAVKRGILQPIEENAEEVVEVWDDGTVTEREPFPEPAPRVPKEEDNLPPGATFKTVRAGEAKKEE